MTASSVRPPMVASSTSPELGPIVTVHVLSLARDKTQLTLDVDASLLRTGLPVLASDGVIGTTSADEGEKLVVRLLTDPGSGVDVLGERQKARGFARGVQGDNTKLRIEYVTRDQDLHVGDLFVTSGVGLRFPKGQRVCTVSEVTAPALGQYLSVLCTPAVDASRLETVQIVLQPAASLTK
ncbi:MAG: rod shape-determining protein MreC [Polyangiaceae bacterium]